MPRKKRVRSPALPRVVAEDALATADPFLAAFVGAGITAHVVSGTQSSYMTATANYEEFCRVRGLSAWPAVSVRVSAWLLYLAGSIRVASMPMYLAGIQYTQGLSSLPWTLKGDEKIRRVMRFLKRTLPAKGSTVKIPVSVPVLRKILPLLPGWPNMAAMSALDRTFATASVLAVCGFLRGGEFLSSSGSSRKVLSFDSVSVRKVGAGLAVVLAISQPKASFWLESQDVFCFASPAGTDNTFCPVRLWEAYARLSPVRLTDSGAAFRGSGGKPLSRDFMVKRTAALLAQAGLSFVDASGNRMEVKAASWRAGAVRSAIDANVPVPFIQASGRWKSAAWIAYLVQNKFDLQGAARAIWGASSSSPHLASGARVEMFEH
jgi:hypothetical protein